MHSNDKSKPSLNGGDEESCNEDEERLTALGEEAPSAEYEREATMVVPAATDTDIIDDKSILRRAYDLIDSTARRTHLVPAIHRNQTVAYGAASPAAHRSAVQNGLVADRSEFMESFESEEALDPVVARAKAKAASAYLNETSEGTSHATGAEYVHARAPGLNRSFYLPLLRLQNLMRNAEAPQAECRAISENLQETAENMSSQNEWSAEFDPEVSREGKSLPSYCIVDRWHRRVCCIYGIVCICILVAIVVGIVCSTKGGSNSQEGERIQPTGVNETTRFSPFTTDCNMLNSQEQPSVLSQCSCTGQITIVADDIAARYYDLTSTFIHSVYPGFNESLHSCSPQNQALLWLASGDGTITNSSSSRMLQRYTMSLLFILWNGSNWTAYGLWLSSADECTWYGLNCNNQDKVISIDLSTNNVVVNLPPVAALLSSLESLKVDENTFQGNTIPTEVGLLSNLNTFVLSGTGINGTIPQELFNIGESLLYFDASQNSLVGTIPTLVGNLVHLRE
jgi:hypothetical protein